MSRRLYAAAALLLTAAACGPITEAQITPASCKTDHATTAAHAVDPFKELLIVDEAVTSDAAAKNASAGPLGFRHAMEQLSSRPEEASSATLGWLATWAPPSFTCAWLRARAENACDATCGTCAEETLDLARAPFRLIAVANRIDLSEPAGHAGEGRLLFAATDGPGDDPASPALAVTVIVELRLPGDRGVWAARWHALGAHDAFGADYIRSLTDLTEGFLRSENLAQIRVNDAMSGARPVLRELHLDPAAANAKARFVVAGLRRTPVRAMDGTAALSEFVTANKEGLLADEYEVPPDMLADHVELGGTWTLPAVDEPLRHTFATGTCDGCHGAEHPVIDGAFHISPLRQGRAKLSTFLFDSEHRADDDLTRRALFLTSLACATP